MSPLASAMLGDQQRVPPLASMVMANAGPAPSIDAATAPAPADAWSQNASAVQDWLAQQQAQSARMGLWNDQTGLPTQAGVMDAARQYANGMQPATIRAFHGSPHDFSAFDMSKIGTGEGAQAYGHGLYFAGNEGVAQGYRDALTPPAKIVGPDGVEHASIGSDGQYYSPYGYFNSGDAEKAKIGRALGWLMRSKGDFAEAAAQAPKDYGPLFDSIKASGARYAESAPGRMYEVNLNVEPGQLLDWDKPMGQQSPQVLDALRTTRPLQPIATGLADDATRSAALGSYIRPNTPVSDVVRTFGIVPPAERSAALRDAGIPGIQYLDGGSRTAGEGSRNYVMFDPNLVDIVRKYGLAGAMLGAPAAAPFMPSQAPQQ